MFFRKRLFRFNKDYYGGQGQDRDVRGLGEEGEGNNDACQQVELKGFFTHVYFQKHNKSKREHKRRKNVACNGKEDVLRKKRTEIDFINGVIVRQAQGLGIPVPVNALLVDLVKTLEASYSLTVAA